LVENQFVERARVPIVIELDGVEPGVDAVEQDVD
jgi:hypothetical protein